MTLHIDLSWRWLLLMLLIGAAYAAVSVSARTGYHIWGDDWAQYVNHARNIAEHRPYGETGYMFNPARPNIGPASYPPGTALLLAPLESRFGLDIAALKLLSIACLSVSLILAMLLAVPVVGRVGAVLCGLMFGLHPAVWAYHGYVVSEPPYILFSLAALLCAQWARGTAAAPIAGLGSAVLTGALVCAAIACRSLGVTLVAGLVIHECMQGRWRRPWMWVMLGTTIAGSLWVRSAFGNADYSEELALFAMARVAQNLWGYLGAFAQLFPLPGMLFYVAPVLLLGLAASGLYARVLPPVLTRQQARWPYLLKAIPLEIWYLFCYLGALTVLPFAAHSRYLLPILPIVAAWLVAGALRWGAARRALLSIMLVAGLCWYGWLWAREPRVAPSGGALCVDCVALYDAVRAQVPPEDAVAFVKPRALALLADRRSWIWSTHSTGAGALQAEFVAARVSWLVTVGPSHELAGLYPEPLSWEGWRRQAGARLVYENPSFRLVRLEPK